MVFQQRSALLVEDDRDFSDIYRRFLAPWNLNIDTATTLVSALEIASHRAYDLYLIDLKLADGDCSELLTRLAAQGKTTSSRCILVTSFPLVATAFTDFPIVGKAELSALAPHVSRILGVPGLVAESVHAFRANP